MMSIMDVSGIFFAVTKILICMKYQRASGVAYCMLGLIWIYVRLYLYGLMCWSAIYELPIFLELKWDPDNGYYMNRLTASILIGFLLALYFLIILWSVSISKIIHRVVNDFKTVGNRSSDKENVSKSYEKCE